MADRILAKSNIAQRRQNALSSGDPDYMKRRAQLLAAAGHVFKQRGFNGANLNEIAKEVGIDRASLYYYTSGKEDLFQQIVRAAVVDNINMVESIQANDDPAGKKVRDLIVRLMYSYEVHFPYLYAFVQEDMNQIATENSDWAIEINSLIRRFGDAATAIIREGIDQGVLNAEASSAEVIAFGIIGMVNWSHRWFKPSGELSAENVGKVYADMVLGGLLRPESRLGEKGQRHTVR